MSSAEPEPTTQEPGEASGSYELPPTAPPPSSEPERPPEKTEDEVERERANNGVASQLEGMEVQPSAGWKGTAVPKQDDHVRK